MIKSSYYRVTTLKGLQFTLHRLPKVTSAIVMEKRYDRAA